MINIYKASAGSGKTHTLTRDFLFLAFENQLNFSKILAVTFTNKAAGEMKERIIEELAKLAETPDKSAFIDDLKHKFNLDSKSLSYNANIILKKILHNYTFFNISTIDSFVQRVIRAFVFELKIPASYKIELDGEKVSTDITDILLSKLNENTDLQKWLTSFAFQRISEGKRWNFRQSIIDFSNQLFNEKFYGVFDETSNSKEKFAEKLQLFSNKINETIAIFEAGIQKLVQKSLKIIKTSGIDSLKVNKIKYLRDFFYRNENELNLELNATLTKAIEDDDFWNKTTKNDIKTQWSNTIDNLKNTLFDIFDYEKKHGKDYYTAQKIKYNLYTFGVINSLKNELPEYRDENNIMLIIDLTLLLKKIIGDNEAPFIYEKIGNRYSYIMIDEFQDTSSFQWQNFKPLIVNSLSENNYNLIVGDVKQSIYRWRNGDWKLLYSGVRNEIGKEIVNETTLDTNWRSKKTIVDFNNSLFNRLPILLQQKINTDLKDVEISEELRNLLPNAYADVYQKVAPKNTDGGYVKLEFFHKEVDFKNIVKEKVELLIADLLEIYSPGDIAILVRTNSDANDFMKMLLDYSSNLPKNKQFNVVSAESLLLSNSMAIRLLVDSFRLIINPDERINLTEINVNYQRLNNIEIENSKVFNVNELTDAKGILPDELLNIFDDLKHLSLFELTEKLISVFGITDMTSELPFVRSFEEKISDFIQNEGSDLKSFIGFWDENQHKFSVQLSEIKDAMQVMTLHKSKGLAFRVVVMPMIDWRLDPKHNSVIWGNTKNSNFTEFEYLPITTTKDLIKTDFSEDYVNEKVYSFMDAINMLYVAFTRAKDSIYGFVPLPKNISGTTIGEHVFNSLKQKSELINIGEYLVNLEEFYDAGSNIFEMGVERKEKETGKTISGNFILDNYPANDWTENISIVTHSEDLISEIVETRQIAIKEGLLMHELFSLIKTYKDISDAIAEMIAKNKITSTDAEIIKKDIERLFQNEQIKYWFEEGWKVQSEKEILTKYGDTKIPDRVISNDTDVIVIDYKFGHKRPEHKRQIRRYMQLMSDIEKGKNVKGFLLYADENKVVEVK